MELVITKALRAFGTTVEFDLTGMWQPVQFTGEEISFPQPIRFRGSVTYTGNESLVSVQGVLQALVERPCYRCLEPARQAMAIDVTETFSRVVDEEEERFLYTGETLELDEMLQQNLLLRLPMRALCSTDCRGLCPRCGKLLNQEDCTCGDKPQPHPELSKWLQENKEV